MGTMKHFLLDCPALSAVRVRMWNLFFDNTVQYPALFQFLLEMEKSSPELKMQFFLDPSAIAELQTVWELFGQQAVDHVYYLARTYMYIICTGKSRSYLAFGLQTTLQVPVKNQKREKSKSQN